MGKEYEVDIESFQGYGESEKITLENIGFFYDKSTKICIYKRRIDARLRMGRLYDITFYRNGDEDEDTYTYIVLKKEADNIYYLAEYYDKFLPRDEEYLAEGWVKCDVKEGLGIDLERWQFRLDNPKGVIDTKIDLLKENIRDLNEYRYDLDETDYDDIVETAENIVKLAYFLKSYKELDNEREKAVKETVMAYLDRNNTYDKPLLDSIGYCFED